MPTVRRDNGLGALSVGGVNYVVRRRCSGPWCRTALLNCSDSERYRYDRSQTAFPIFPIALYTNVQHPLFIQQSNHLFWRQK